MTAPLQNDIQALHIRSCFLQYRRLPAPRFRKAKLDTLEVIARLTDYENVIENISRDDMQKALKTTGPNLMRTLRRAEPYIRVYTSTDNHGEFPVPTGHLRVEINPALAWRESKRISRSQAIKLWYLTEDLSEMSNKDLYVNGNYVDHFGNEL